MTGHGEAASSHLGEFRPHLLMDIPIGVLHDSAMEQGNPKIHTQIRRDLKTKLLADPSSFVSCNIVREADTRLGSANLMPRALIELNQHHFDELNLSSQSAAKENQIISQKKMRKFGGPSCSRKPEATPHN